MFPVTLTLQLKTCVDLLHLSQRRQLLPLLEQCDNPTPAPCRYTSSAALGLWRKHFECVLYISEDYSVHNHLRPTPPKTENLYLNNTALPVVPSAKLLRLLHSRLLWDHHLRRFRFKY
jgi:hypothetical protein